MMRDQFSQFVTDLPWDSLPEKTPQTARLWRFNLIRGAMAGSHTEVSRIAKTHAAGRFRAGTRGARLLFDGRVVSPQGAA